jgi:nucleoside-diphosphate-sugar epimerase
MTRVLVTGAGGGLGGRIVEKLVLERGTPLRAMVRRHARAVRLARFPLDLVAADMTDRQAVDAAMEGCDVVVHCAHDLTHPERNAPGADVLARAALAHGVRRFVYLSSASVHEPATAGRIDESSPTTGSVDGLDETRRDAEARLLGHAEAGLNLVVLRPALVYGPYSPHWTMGVADNLRWRKVVVPDGGRGICNAVYVDDVVDTTLMAALDRPEARGPYLLAGPGTVTWREFYEAFAREMGVSGSLGFEEGGEGAEQQQRARDVLIGTARDAARGVTRAARAEAMRPVRKQIARAIGPYRTRVVKQAVTRRMPPKVVLPTAREHALYISRATVDHGRAVAELGYGPDWDFGRGMARTGAFLRWANL